jgi:PPOX class probable F420-dependent enzyme
MSDREVTDFLAEQRTLTCATRGNDGWPHLMPLWYVVRDGELWAWTYAKSQKVRNLERDPRCTLQVETGDEYGELRGVMIKADCELVRHLDAVAALAAELAERYEVGGITPEVEAAWTAQARKRVALRFRPRAVASWDHRKL